MSNLFGTDGIRGTANEYPITPEIALKVGKAVAVICSNEFNHKVRILLGRDPRISGEMLSSSIAGGLMSMGADVYFAGVLPTPAVAYLTRTLKMDCGIMITASHNPARDNGIKIFGSDGFKLNDDFENQIQKMVFDGFSNSMHISGIQVGTTQSIDNPLGKYSDFIKKSVHDCSLNGLKIVLDCANGAASEVAPLLFSKLGADLILTGTTPNGLNINNQCGATHPENMSALVLKHGADLGIALDGDADRVIFCDSAGSIVNGDRIIALCALEFKKRSMLKNDSVVVTSMTNLGFHKAMRAAGINVIVADVGDRFVIEKMRLHQCNIGGEQSGHIIIFDYVTTGDGIITALHILLMMQQQKKSIKTLADCMEEFPQCLTNLPVKEKIPFEDCPALRKIILECEDDLGSNGRVIVRYSGTESKIRILLEAKNKADVQKWTEQISKIVRKELGE